MHINSHTKFQLPLSINSWDMRGSQHSRWRRGCAHAPSSGKIVNTVEAPNHVYSWFFKMTAADLVLLKYQIFNGRIAVKKVEVCHRAKFHKNRWKRGGDMVIFIFFKMTSTAILDFQNFNFSTVRTVKRVERHHYAEFCRNRFNRGRDIAIFRYFKTAEATILNFWNLILLTVGTVNRLVSILR